MGEATGQWEWRSQEGKLSFLCFASLLLKRYVL